MSLVMPSPARAAGNPAHVRFAPLAAADLPLLHAWLNAPRRRGPFARPHDARRRGASTGLDGTGRGATSPRWPGGRSATYRRTNADFPTMRRPLASSAARSRSTLIGESSTRAAGSARARSRQPSRSSYSLSDADVCVATPRADNTASLRAFAKAGLRWCAASAPLRATPRC
jgi:hypothetical protein